MCQGNQQANSYAMQQPQSPMGRSYGSMADQYSGLGRGYGGRPQYPGAGPMGKIGYGGGGGDMYGNDMFAGSPGFDEATGQRLNGYGPGGMGRMGGGFPSYGQRDPGYGQPPGMPPTGGNDMFMQDPRMMTPNMPPNFMQQQQSLAQFRLPQDSPEAQAQKLASYQQSQRYLSPMPQYPGFMPGG